LAKKLKAASEVRGTDQSKA